MNLLLFQFVCYTQKYTKTSRNLRYAQGVHSSDMQHTNVLHRHKYDVSFGQKSVCDEAVHFL